MLKSRMAKAMRQMSPSALERTTLCHGPSSTSSTACALALAAGTAATPVAAAAPVALDFGGMARARAGARTHTRSRRGGRVWRAPRSDIAWPTRAPRAPRTRAGGSHGRLCVSV
jgi:hypothetical protein